MKESYVLIGHTKKTHGAQGEVKVVIKDRFLEDFVNSDHIFISIQGKPVPFFIENIREVGDLLLKLEDIDSPAEAKEIIARELFLREKDLVYGTGEDVPVSSFAWSKGFFIEDAEQGLIGEIRDVVEYPQQEIAIVIRDGQEVLIPLHASLVVKVDKSAKKLFLRLPDGILEL
jgi:16S rRNA processing protein RimM